VKTTYYLHMKPRHTAEQSTVRVNKSEDIGSGAKRGFGAAAPATSPAVVAAPTATEPAPGEKELAQPSPAPVRRGFGFSGLAAKGENN
jgi:ribonucleoside-diphosphate reductase alpha chain